MYKSIRIFLLTVTTTILITNLASCSTKEEGKMEEAQEQKSAPAQKPQYIMTVNQGDEVFGDIIIELYPDVAPKTCKNFDSLVSDKFFDGTAFHRVVPGFVIQGGDPNSKNKPKETWGMGDPGQTTVPAEFNSVKHQRGILSMARSQDPNSATSQFFICLADISHLDGSYTGFGKVITGMEVVDKIVKVPLEGRSGFQGPVTKVVMTVRKK